MKTMILVLFALTLAAGIANAQTQSTYSAPQPGTDQFNWTAGYAGWG
jgi:hypothetical protein